MMLLKIFLDIYLNFGYNAIMKNEIATKMSPEGLEIANAYLEYGNIQETATALAVDENTISPLGRYCGSISETPTAAVSCFRFLPLTSIS